jgi:hypothetical protein
MNIVFVNYITEGKGFMEEVCNGGSGSDCQAESEPYGTATLFSHSLSRKCLLHKYVMCSILAESLVQDIPTFPAHIPDT